MASVSKPETSQPQVARAVEPSPVHERRFFLWVFFALAFFGLASVSLATGLLRFLGWFVPTLTPGLLPRGFVGGMADLYQESGGVLRAVHLVSGPLLALAAAAFLVRGRRVGLNALAPPGESATTAFWRWVGGRFTRNRIQRLHFRDALMLPTFEFAIAITIAIATAPLVLLPLGDLSATALLLHRINALYLLFLAFYASLAVLFARQRPSPWPTTIRGGAVHRSRWAKPKAD